MLLTRHLRSQKLNMLNNPISLSIRPFSESKTPVPEQSFPTPITDADNPKLAAKLCMLKDVDKLRVNQTKLTRIGTKPAREASVQEFVVVNSKNDESILFIKIYHSMIPENYRMEVFKFSDKGDNPPSACLVTGHLQRSNSLRTISLLVFDNCQTINPIPLAYIYDLDGVRRTAIIENGSRDKCFYQCHIRSALDGWKGKVILYNARGSTRLGHFTKLLGHNNRLQINAYLRLFHGLDVQSKCIFIMTMMFLMGYDYVR